MATDPAGFPDRDKPYAATLVSVFTYRFRA